MASGITRNTGLNEQVMIAFRHPPHWKERVVCLLMTSSGAPTYDDHQVVPRPISERWVVCLLAMEWTYDSRLLETFKTLQVTACLWDRTNAIQQYPVTIRNPEILNPLGSYCLWCSWNDSSLEGRWSRVANKIPFLYRELSVVSPLPEGLLVRGEVHWECEKEEALTQPSQAIVNEATGFLGGVMARLRAIGDSIRDFVHPGDTQDRDIEDV